LSKEDVIKIDGTVAEVLPNRVVRLELANGHRLLGHLSAPMRENLIKLSPGERVMVALSPYDLSKGCIVERLTEQKL
jgi:translation initiation factor IF-1